MRSNVVLAAGAGPSGAGHSVRAVNLASRNEPCPCGSGRKFKRCCAELADIATRTAAAHAAVGKRIQAWAGEHHRDALGAAWAEITAGREDVGLGDVDIQLIAAWIFSDRELPGGGTAAERYCELDHLDPVERDIAARIAAARLGLMRVTRVAPGLWIDLEDCTRRDTVRAISQGVSAHTRPGDLIVARRMDGPPARSLWGPVGFVTAETGPQLSDLIAARIRPGQPGRPHDLSTAIRDASLEISILLSPALRQPTTARRAA
jgi:hypothetical protein